jgi:hypothetical protein
MTKCGISIVHESTSVDHVRLRRLISSGIIIHYNASWELLRKDLSFFLHDRDAWCIDSWWWNWELSLPAMAEISLNFQIILL